ncbi:MAG: TatD family hydrolase [Cellvibrionaceae bacterium]
MLVDSHCHLDRLNLEKCGGSVEAALAHARERGVERFLCISISFENVADVVGYAEQYDDVYASVGVHPCDVSADVPREEKLLQLADHPRVVGIGETGLDYYYSQELKGQQQESFHNHLKVAAKTKKPVIVHTRDAKEDTLSIIRESSDPEVGGVLHCFTEDWDMASRALDMNFYISLSGIVTFKNAEQLRDVAKKVPLDRLLVETDSPYLAPVPYRGKPNQPAWVREVAEYIAEHRGMSYEALAEQTTENFFRLFNQAS